MKDLEFLLNNKSWIIRLIEAELPSDKTSLSAEDLFKKAISAIKSGSLNGKKAANTFSKMGLDEVLTRYSNHRIK